MKKLLLCIGIVSIGIVCVIFFFTASAQTPQGTLCSIYMPGQQTIAAGFGMPWNVFNVSEMLVKAYCQGTTVTAQLGPSTYVYHQGYVWVNGAWTPTNFTCTGGAKVRNAWCPTSAQGILPQGATYYLGYTCNWTGTKWNCGCRDQECSTNYWQIQKIGLASMTPVANEQYPRGAKQGVTTALLGPEGERHGTNSRDTFRTVAWFTHFLKDDPIVYPGQPGASHLHMFFGNSRVNANTTVQNIRSNCSSNASGGTANCSSYWIPAIIDSAGKPVLPNRGQYEEDLVIYYKTGYDIPDPRAQVATPLGLRMVAGDMTANPSRPQNIGHFSFSCNGQGDTSYIPSCPQGAHFEARVEFPRCWNGVDLDSPNHKSHMAYTSGNRCPASHPYPIPQITLNVHFGVADPNGTDGWRLASDMYDLSQRGGYSLHADWFNGWDPAIMDRWLRNCNHALVDCGVDNLGDGQALRRQ